MSCRVRLECFVIEQGIASLDSSRRTNERSIRNVRHHMFLEAELLMWSAHQDQIQTSRWHPNNLVGWQRIKKPAWQKHSHMEIRNLRVVFQFNVAATRHFNVTVMTVNDECPYATVNNNIIKSQPNFRDNILSARTLSLHIITTHSEPAP